MPVGFNYGMFIAGSWDMEIKKIQPTRTYLDPPHQVAKCGGGGSHCSYIPVCQMVYCGRFARIGIADPGLRFAKSHFIFDRMVLYHYQDALSHWR